MLFIQLVLNRLKSSDVSWDNLCGQKPCCIGDIDGAGGRGLECVSEDCLAPWTWGQFCLKLWYIGIISLVTCGNMWAVSCQENFWDKYKYIYKKIPIQIQNCKPFFAESAGERSLLCVASMVSAQFVRAAKPLLTLTTRQPGRWKLLIEPISFLSTKHWETQLTTIM